jgi:YegS/Rv2252/BmrU family lipid kinase
MEEMRLIINPVAANGAVGKKWPRIKRLLEERKVPFSFHLTEGRGHAIALAQEARKAGYTTIIVVGGDGTLNEVVNGLVEEGRIAPEVRLGVIPGGTGADFRRTMGIPLDYSHACECVLKGETRLIDLGEIECTGPEGKHCRYFANVAGLGFDGEVAERVNRISKAPGGTIPYLTGLFITLVGYQNKNIRFWLDGEERRGRFNSVIVANCRYLGGGMFVAPNAQPDDGLFDVIVLGDLGHIEFAVNVPKVYNGTHLTHPKVSSYRAHEMRVEAAEHMLLQADGELVGEAPATFRILPQALRVVV